MKLALTAVLLGGMLAACGQSNQNASDPNEIEYVTNGGYRYYLEGIGRPWYAWFTPAKEVEYVKVTKCREGAGPMSLEQCKAQAVETKNITLEQFQARFAEAEKQIRNAYDAELARAKAEKVGFNRALDAEIAKTQAELADARENLDAFWGAWRGRVSKYIDHDIAIISNLKKSTEQSIALLEMELKTIEPLNSVRNAQARALLQADINSVPAKQAQLQLLKKSRDGAIAAIAVLEEQRKKDLAAARRTKETLQADIESFKAGRADADSAYQAAIANAQQKRESEQDAMISARAAARQLYDLSASGEHVTLGPNQVAWFAKFAGFYPNLEVVLGIKSAQQVVAGK